MMFHRVELESLCVVKRIGTSKQARRDWAPDSLDEKPFQTDPEVDGLRAAVSLQQSKHSQLFFFFFKSLFMSLIYKQ